MVNLIKFRIKNYKSIKDSGDCYIANGITVLAGRNESGKTSILEALEDFDTAKKIRQEAIPINNSQLKPEIELTFEVDRDECQTIYDKLKLDGKTAKITILKNSENVYFVKSSEEFFSKTLKENEKQMKIFEKNVETITKIVQKYDIGITLNALTDESFSKVSAQVSSLKQNLDPHLAKISEDEKTKITEIIVILNQIINNYIKPEDLEKEFLEEFKRYIPNFIFFETYKDGKIPNAIPFSELDKDEFVRDLAVMSDLDINLIKSTEMNREKFKHNKEINFKIFEDYKEFWKQDDSNLSISWENNKLFFWVIEDDEVYPPNIRSKGKQWHLAFYIKVSARSKEDVPNILLIDEPGLFLHAKAQKDILKKLENCSNNLEIVYSTHSPYLIDPQHLNRVRLVEKDKHKGTKITKVHAKADKETLTPILTAIGEDLSQGIRVDKKNSFVVEGISDYYYLHAFAKILGFKKEFNLIPGCGDNIPAVGSILFGWGLDPFFILDGDKTKLVNTLKNKLDIAEDSILKVLDGNGSVENIFSEEDFKKFILEDADAHLSKGIIKHLKEQKLSKELLSRKFIEKVNSGAIKKETLSANTVQNMEKLFQKIDSLINKNPEDVQDD